MKEFFALVGVVLLLACLWLGVLTFQQGGIKRGSGDPPEVLTAAGWAPPNNGNDVVQVVPQPTRPPPPTAALPPTATVSPPVPMPPTVSPVPLPTAVAVMDRVPTQDDGELPAEWVAGPPGVNSYTAAPIPISPWEVLGWILVGLVPAGGALAAGLVVYRQVVLTRAQVQQLPASMSWPAMVPHTTGPGPAGGGDLVAWAAATAPPGRYQDVREGSLDDPGEGRPPLDIAAYLAGQGQAGTKRSSGVHQPHGPGDETDLESQR